jgi:RecA-family ATPase
MNKLNLSTLIIAIGLPLGLSAQVEPEAKLSCKLAIELRAANDAISESQNSDQQPKAFSKAYGVIEKTVRHKLAQATATSTDETTSKNREQVLNEYVLLTAKMLRLEKSQQAMDYFGPYTLDQEERVLRQIKTLEEGNRFDKTTDINKARAEQLRTKYEFWKKSAKGTDEIGREPTNSTGQN